MLIAQGKMTSINVDNRRNGFVIALCALALVVNVFGDEKPVLQTLQTDMWEFGNATLRCSCPKNSISISTFHREDDTKQVNLILFTNKTCYMNPTDLPVEDFMCVDNITFQLTIKLHRQENGFNWSCSCGLQVNIKSDQVVIFVNVPVVKTNLQIDNNNISEDKIIQTVNSSSLTLKCLVSCARPEPMITWYKPAISTDIISNSSTCTNELCCSNSTLHYKPTLESQNHQVYCSASNKENEHHKSSKITIEVLYPPRAGQMLNTSTIEGKNFKIMCNGTKGKPNQTEYIWSNRNNASISKEMILNIRTVSRTDQTYYTCTMKNNMTPTYGSSVEGISSARFYLTVQYKPNITSIVYSSGQSYEQLVFGQTVYVIEKESFNISCFAKSKPKPNISWTGPAVSNSHDLVLHDVNRNKNGTYFCHSTNTMIFNNTRESGRSEENVTVNVLYPPSVANISDTSTIEGKDIEIMCNGEPGNPNQKEFYWSNGNIGNISKEKNLTIRNVSRTNETYYTCTMKNAMKPTFGNFVDGNSSAEFYLTVHYKPDITSLVLASGVRNRSLVHGQTVFVIENESYNISCFANSKPKPKTLWHGTIRSQSHVLIIPNVNRNKSGMYTCLSTNKMPFNNTIEIGTSHANVTLVVLYPAIVNDIHNVSIVEGSPLETLCPVVDGNPSNSTVTWSRNSDENQWINRLLLINNVSREDDSTYTCSVKTEMKPSIGSSSEVERNGSFHLNVFFPSEIKSFLVSETRSSEGFFVKNQRENALLICTAEAKPLSSLTIENPRGNNISQTTESDIAQHTLHNVSFIDAGEYTCSGWNNYTRGLPTKSKLILIVRSKPRPSYGDTNVPNVATAMHDNVTLQFLAWNYLDEPNKTSFKWLKENVSVPDNDSKYLIHVHELQTNLTIKNTTQQDLGFYQVTVKNSVGVYTHYYELKATDKPEPPRDFRVLNNTITDTSVTLVWSPGFNGGFQQEFIIVYKMKRKIIWYNISTTDNGDKIMNYTLHDLSSSQEYETEMFAKNIEGNSFKTERLQFKTKETLTSEVKSQPGNRSGIIAGSISAVVIAVVVIVVVVVVFFLRKRRTKNTDSLYQNVPVFGKKCTPKVQKNAYKKRRNCQTEETKFEENPDKCDPNLNGHEHKRYIDESDEQTVEGLQEVDDDPIILNEKTEYCNSPGKIERITVAELYAYVLGNDDNIEAEYQKLPTGLQKPCTFARKPENIALNRYNGIYPYDHSRVKITEHPEFFINACYIDGYRKKKAYIASLGPTGKTTSDFQTFWQMVWHERSDMIVMLTNLHEPSGMKCEKYWPDEGTKMQYGDVIVKNTSFEVFAEYTIRTFGVSKGNQHRSLTHLHYTAWPDKTVPEDVTSLLEFRKRMKDVPITQSGPIIIHCSAGIGRTGTLIALDILIEEGMDMNSVNVFECVNKLRTQRVKMIQTVEQYIYLHKCLVNALSFDGETVTKKKINEHLVEKNEQHYNTLFEQLKMSVETDSASEGKARLKNRTYSNKNRQGADVPGDRYIVFLNLTDGREGSEYINAVYVNSFKRKDHFIVAQTPLPNTVTDFISLIFTEDCSCIATMEDLKDPKMSVGPYLPEKVKSVIFGNYEVSCSTLEENKTWVIRKLKIKYKGKYDEAEKCFYHFQYKQWIKGSKTPRNVEDFVQFVREVEEYANELGEDRSRVLVHCMMANERSCLFCTVAIIMEKLKEEGKVNILNVIRHLRTRRRNAILSKEQLKFCYEAASAYVRKNSY